MLGRHSLLTWMDITTDNDTEGNGGSYSVRGCQSSLKTGEGTVASHNLQQKEAENWSRTCVLELLTVTVSVCVKQMCGLLEKRVRLLSLGEAIASQTALCSIDALQMLELLDCQIQNKS